MKLTTYKNSRCEEGDPCIGHFVSWTVHVNDPVPTDYRIIRRQQGRSGGQEHILKTKPTQSFCKSELLG